MKDPNEHLINILDEDDNEWLDEQANMIEEFLKDAEDSINEVELNFDNLNKKLIVANMQLVDKTGVLVKLEYW